MVMDRDLNRLICKDFMPGEPSLAEELLDRTTVTAIARDKRKTDEIKKLDQRLADVKEERDEKAYKLQRANRLIGGLMARIGNMHTYLAKDAISVGKEKCVPSVLKKKKASGPQVEICEDMMTAIRSSQAFKDLVHCFDEKSHIQADIKAVKPDAKNPCR